MNGVLICTAACFLTAIPRLTCDPPAVNLGKLRSGPAISHRFTLINRSEAEVRIVHLRPSCGCLASRLSGKILKPGDAIDLVVQVNTISQPEGVNLWTTTVFYRVAGLDTDHSLDLQIRAELTREVAIQPATVSLSGKPGLAHAVQLIDRRTSPMEILNVNPSSSRLKVRDEGSWQRAEAEWVRTFHLRMSADCPPGRHDDFIQIVARDPDYRDVRIPVTLNRTDRQRVVASPPEVLWTARHNEFRVILHDRDDQPIEIEGIWSDDPAIMARYPSVAQRRPTIQLGRLSDQQPRPWSLIRVQLRQPERKTLVIPITIVSEDNFSGSAPRGGE